LSSKIGTFLRWCTFSLKEEGPRCKSVLLLVVPAFKNNPNGYFSSRKRVAALSRLFYYAYGVGSPRNQLRFKEVFIFLAERCNDSLDSYPRVLRVWGLDGWLVNRRNSRRWRWSRFSLIRIQFSRRISLCRT